MSLDLSDEQLAEALKVRFFSEPAMWDHAAKLISRLKACRHSSDFGSIVWQGKAYSLTPAQGAVMRVLWENWENGTPDIRQETALVQAGLDSKKLTDVFDAPLIGEVVVPSPSGVRGLFRLKT